MHATPGTFTGWYFYPQSSNPTFGWGIVDCFNTSGLAGQESGYVGGECPANAGLDINLSSRSSTVCTFAKLATPKSAGNPTHCEPYTPHPISIATGNKWLPEQDYAGSGSSPLKFVRTYNGLPASSGLLGRQWRSSIEHSLMISVNQSVPNVGILRPDGRALTYQWDGSAWVGDADVTERLLQIKDAGGATTEWQYILENADVEHYDVSGKLLSISDRRGFTETFTYSDGTTGSNGGFVLDAQGNSTATALPAGLVIRVTDAAGRSLSFGYDVSSRIVKMIDPAGGIYLYQYDANNNFASVAYPDGKTRQYLYGEAAYTSGTSLPNALTGIIDENGARYASYHYDSSGRAISSELGTDMPGGSVEKYALLYNVDGSGNPLTTVTDPLNSQRTYGFDVSLGVARSKGVSQPGGSGCGAASSNLTYDPNGNVSSRTDFNQHKTCYGYDLSRNLETVRVEGLNSTDDCAAALAAGTQSGVARKITTTWDPTYRLPTVITEPGRITTNVYDPASGNLLSKTIQDTASGKSRSWSYTYTGAADNTLANLVKTVDGPRTDVADITAYTYYTADDTIATPPKYRRGDLHTLTNALGQSTTLTSYDGNGRPLTIVDPNGVTTTLAYTPRGWLHSRTVGSQTTTYDYDFVGQLKRVTLADGSHLDYTYDAAHRLTDIFDAQLNHVHYTLDAMGNRTREEVSDAGGTLTTTKSRLFDPLNRLYQDIATFNQGASAATTYGYDANGNLTSVTDPLNHTTSFAYDALNRLTQVTDAINTTSPTRYGYDALDQLRSVTDPRSLNTAYTVNALGNATQQSSPDSGVTNRSFDDAGNVSSATDARGITASYTYDALNRPTSVSYPATGENLAYTWDVAPGCNYGIGRLCRVTDGGGTTSFAYDSQGNVLSQTRVEAGVSLTTQYRYDGANRLSTEITPTGETLSLGRDMAGRVSNVATSNAGVATTLARDIVYDGAGQVTGQLLGNGVKQSMVFDLSGRAAALSVNRVDGDLNGDGAVDVADVALAERMALGLLAPTADQLGHGDVAPAGNPDGVIDAADVARITRKALGLESF